jgi:hypothetical protein
MSPAINHWVHELWGIYRLSDWASQEVHPVGYLGHAEIVTITVSTFSLYHSAYLAQLFWRLMYVSIRRCL